MKGRISATIWMVVGINAAVLIAVLGLAYAAGSRSGGLSLLDFGALPQTAGFEFLGAAFLLVAVTLWMIFFLGGRIVKPVTQVTELTERLAAGETETHLSLESGDEFALIVENCNRMAETLGGAALARSSSEALQNEAAEFNTALGPALRGELMARVRAGEGGLQELSTTINGLLEFVATRLHRARMNLAELDGAADRAANATGATQAALRSQESSISEATQSATALAGAIREGTKTVRSAGQLAAHAAELAQHGSQVVSEASEGVERIRSAMADTAARIKSLGERSLQIYEIINIIQDTNLLALNASIEASQAGDPTKGIQVMRTELNKLAEHSRASVREIVNLLKTIQAESSEVLALVEQANRAADVGGRLTEQCGKAFSAISAELIQSSDLAEGLTEAARNQAEDSDRLALLVRSMAADSVHAIQSATDASNTVQQVIKTTEQVKEQLASLRTSASKPRPELAASAAARG